VDISGIFEILGKYVDFVVDFLSFGGLQKYQRLGSVSPELMSFFVASVVLSYAIALAKRIPTYESRIPSGKDSAADRKSADSSPPDSDPDGDKALTKDSSEILTHVLLSIGGAAFFHGTLLLYHWIRGGESIGNIKDTINAALATNAVYNPCNAFLKQLQRLANAIARVSRRWAIAASLVLLSLSLLYFLFIFYWIDAFAGVHGTTRMYMLPPLATMGILKIVISVLLIRSQKASRAVQAAAQQAPAADERKPSMEARS